MRETLDTLKPGIGRENKDEGQFQVPNVASHNLSITVEESCQKERV